MKILFEDHSSFLYRFTKSLSVPLIILIFWFVIVVYNNIEYNFVYIILILLMFLYTLIVLIKQNYYYINLIEIDDNDAFIVIHTKQLNKQFRKINTEIQFVNFRKERMTNTIYKHEKLILYLSGEKIFTQFPLGKWDYKEMDRIINYLNNLKHNS